MRRAMSSVIAAAVFALLLTANLSFAQGDKKRTLLPTKGFGSLTGKVTYDGDPPAEVNLVELMKKHADKDCCLAPKAKDIEKIDPTWKVDKKTKGVANVMIWIKAPIGTYLETHPKLKVRKEQLVIDQPHCAFLPRMTAFQPYYLNNGTEVATGQSILVKNSAVVPHNIRATGNPLRNPGFNKNMPPMTEIDISADLKTQPLPISLQCDFHPWMAAKLFVFDHPYYAITKADGTFEIPFVPAGAEVSIMGWHEGIGYTNGNMGKKMVIKAGVNTLEVKISNK